MNRTSLLSTASALSLGFLAVLVVLVYPTLIALHHRWLSGAIEYGYLVVVMATYVAYKWIVRRPINISRGGWLWLVPFLFLMATVLVSNLVGIGLVPQLIFPMIVFVSLGLLMGRDVALRLLPPLLFLYFTIPFWQGLEYVGLSGIPLNETLRQLTVFVVSAAVSISGIPALIDGDFIILPSGVIEIAEGCSGRAYFITALELSIFYALAFLRTGRNRLLLIVIACTQALLGNWIRVFALTMIGFYSEMQHPLVVDHSDFGWVIFCITTLPFVFIGRWLEGKEQVDTSSDVRLSVASVDQTPSRWVVIATVSIVGVLLIQNGIRYVGSSTDPINWSDESLLTNLTCLGEWPRETRPIYATAASSWSTSCKLDGRRISVFVADYPFQLQGQEAIHFDNQPVPGGDIVRRAIAQLDAAAGDEPLRFTVLESGRERDRRVTWVAYRVAGVIAGGNLDAKFLQLKGVLSGRLDAQVYVLTANCGDACDAAEVDLRRFASGNVDELFRDRRER